MRIMGILVVAVLILGVFLAANAAAKYEYEENITLTDLETAILHYYRNLTGEDAQWQRYYIDRYYDPVHYYGDDEVQQADVDEYQKSYEQMYEDDPWYYYLDGELATIDDCECIVSNALGSTESTADVSIHYTMELSFDHIDEDAADHIIQRQAPYGDIEFSFASSANMKILKSYGIDDSTVLDSSVSGTIEEDEMMVIVFTIDADKDGHLDTDDAFPEDPVEWEDTDGDGVGNNQDVFDDDPAESKDSDGDGHGNYGDAFPDDSKEWADADADGHGDNSDAFPDDDKEWTDTDGDGHGDNADRFPYDSTEWDDSDGDGVGDNSDAFPNAKEASIDTDGDGCPDAWNDGLEPTTTSLSLDNRPTEKSVNEVEEEPLSTGLLGAMIGLAVFLLILTVALVVLLIMIKKKGAKKPAAPATPPPPPPGQTPPGQMPQQTPPGQPQQQPGGYPPQGQGQPQYGQAQPPAGQYQQGQFRG